MGSGVGISLFGTHRVAGEKYRFAMPETAIGLFPDVGAAWPLSRMPDNIGMYLGLTGRSIGAADAYALGLLTHCIPASRFEEIKAALADTWPVDTVLDDMQVDPGPGRACAVRLAHRLLLLGAERRGDRRAARRGRRQGAAPGREAVIADLAARSPISFKVTHRHIRDARALDLRQTLSRRLPARLPLPRRAAISTRACARR